MANIEELQSRITQALQRIDKSTEEMGGPSIDTSSLEAELVATKQALDDEKLTTAQLEERITALNTKHTDEIEAVRQQSTGQAEAMAQVDVELQRLRKVSEQLRENNQALREANEAGVGEPHLVNKSMLAELEALRAERAAEVAEINAILNNLKPLISEEEQA